MNNRNWLENVQHIHFVGIGGSGMSPLAEILHTKGYVLSGSDNNESDNLTRLRGLGISIVMGHAAANVEGADLHIVEKTFLAQVTRTDSCELHEAQWFLCATQLLADIVEHAQSALDLVFHEGVVDLDRLEDGGESGVTAVVRPVGIEDTEFGLGRVALLFLEIGDYLVQVVRVHRKSPLFAECRKIGRAHV